MIKILVKINFIARMLMTKKNLKLRIIAHGYSKWFVKTASKLT